MNNIRQAAKEATQHLDTHSADSFVHEKKLLNATEGMPKGWVARIAGLNEQAAD